jgi:hypothetical protein
MWTLLFALPAAAYELRLTEDGAPVAWPRFPQTWEGAAGDDAFMAAFEGAFDHWTAVEGAELSFERASGEVSAPRPAPDAVNLVFMERSWPFGDDALAMASVWADERGNIVAFDIQVNSDAAWGMQGEPLRYDLEAAITHEVGHVLGIEHSPFAEATMYASHGRGETWRRELADDDRAAAAFLYPARPGTAAPSPDRDPEERPIDVLIGGAQCAHAGVQPLPLLLLVPFAVRRRTRALEKPCS